MIDPSSLTLSRLLTHALLVDMRYFPFASLLIAINNVLLYALIAWMIAPLCSERNFFVKLNQYIMDRWFGSSSYISLCCFGYRDVEILSLASLPHMRRRLAAGHMLSPSPLMHHPVNTRYFSVTSSLMQLIVSFYTFLIAWMIAPRKPSHMHCLLVARGAHASSFTLVYMKLIVWIRTHNLGVYFLFCITQSIFWTVGFESSFCLPFTYILGGSLNPRYPFHTCAARWHPPPLVHRQVVAFLAYIGSNAIPHVSG
jgi:hypothetical protein